EKVPCRVTRHSLRAARLPEIHEAGPTTVAQQRHVQADVDVAGDAGQAGVNAAAVAAAAVVGHDRSIVDLGQGEGRGNGVLEVSNFIDQSQFPGVGSAVNAAVGQDANSFLREAPTLGDDADELIVEAVDEILEDGALDVRHVAQRVAEVLDGAGFDGVGG